MYDLVICSKMTIGIELLINYNHSCDTKSCVISDAILNGFECNCRKNHNCTKMFVMISISVKESTLFFGNKWMCWQSCCSSAMLFLIKMTLTEAELADQEQNIL